ncbi:MAG: hypothetical protein RLZZ316_1356 [Bacteroidota bacterium]
MRIIFFYRVTNSGSSWQHPCVAPVNSSTRLLRNYLLVSFFVLFSVTNVTAQNRGQAFIDSVEALLPTVKNDTARVRMYKLMSEECMRNLPAKALPYARKSLVLSQQMGWEKAIAALYLNMGMIHATNFSNTDSAIYFYKLSYDLFDKNGLKQPANTVLNKIGVLYQDAGNYTKGVEYFTLVLKNAEALKDTVNMISSLANIALTHNQHYNYTKSAAVYKKALLLLQKSGHTSSLAKVHAGLAMASFKLKDSVTAYSNYKKAISWAIKTGDDATQGSCYANMAEIEADLFKRIELRKKASILIDKVTPGNVSSISNLSALGQAYYNVVKEDRVQQIPAQSSIPKTTEALLQLARNCYNTALAYSVKLNHKTYVAQVNGMIADLNEYNKDYKAAYNNYRDYAELNDSIFSQDNKNKLAQAEAKFEMEKKNAELAIKDLTIANQNKLRAGLIIGLLLLAIIGALLYWQSRTRKKTNTTLLQLNTELDEANKVKAKFFGILSHDLRAPIANLVNFLHLQKEEPGLFNAAQTAAHQQKITHATGALLDTMEAMLLWSKGQMEQFKPQVKTIPVENLYNHLRNYFATTQWIQFNFEAPAGLMINTDEHYLQTIMHNLTANAVKALSQTNNATVTWKAWQQGAQIYLSVTDNGPGINNEQAKALYDDKATTGSKFGLGLHIIRDLAKAINCTITFQTAPQGAQFVLAL